MTRIYALCDPNSNSPRYVGKTSCSLKQRFSGHLTNAKGDKKNENLANWINELLSNGQLPSIVLLEECAPKDTSKVEAAWIVSYRQQGYQLLNIALPSTSGQRSYTTVQILRDRRKKVEKLWFIWMAKNGKKILLRDFFGLVFDAGIESLTRQHNLTIPPKSYAKEN